MGVSRKRKGISFFNILHYRHINSAALDAGAFFTEEKIFYNRIAKAANSSTLLYLFQLLRKQYLQNAEAKAMVTRAWSLTLSQALDFDNYYKFTVVRNPYHRVLSAFNDKLATGESTRKAFTSLPGFNDASPGGFESFVHHLQEDNNVFGNHHWQPQHSLLIVRPEKFNRIAKVENYASDFAQVLDDLGVLYENKDEFGRIFPTITKKDYKSEDLAKQFYTSQTQNIIYKLYQKDFDIFKYQKNVI